MSSTQSVGRLGKHASSFAISGLLAAVGMLIMASVAMAGPDPLKGGATTFNLKLPKKVKIKSPGGGASLTGTALELPITGGSLDPTNGAGAVEDGGTFVLKKGKKKVTVSVVKPTFGGPYGGGSLSADLATPKKKKKKKSASTAAVKTLADLTGGTLSRVGFGARIASANAVLTKGGAKALNKALGLKKKKKNGKKNKNRFKKGKSLADVSTTTIPLTVEVIGGIAITHGSTGFGKLAAGAPPACMGNPFPAGSGQAGNRGCYGKGVNPLPNAGITASGGASYTTAGGPITSPVVAGSTMAPDGSDGMVKTGGTVQIKKTIPAVFAYGAAIGGDPVNAAACDAAMPNGNFIQFTNTTNDFRNKNVLVDLTIQSPALGFPGASPFGNQIPSGHIDLANSPVVSDANAHTINVDGFAVRNENAAQIGLINGTFGTGANPPGGNGCGVAATNAAIPDALFTVDLHMVTH